MRINNEVKLAIIYESRAQRNFAEDYFNQHILAAFPDLIEEISSRKAAYQTFEHQLGNFLIKKL